MGVRQRQTACWRRQWVSNLFLQWCRPLLRTSFHTCLPADTAQEEVRDSFGTREILLPPETGVGLQGRSKLVQEKEGSLREEMASLCSQNRVPIPGNCGHSSSTLFPQLPSPDPSTNPHTSSLAPVPGPAACQEPECTLGASAGSRHHREGVCGSHSGTILGDNRADLGAEN